jgi:hypothetical protein
MSNKFLVIFGILVACSAHCGTRCKAPQLTGDRYEGFALAFFQKPESGRGYQVAFIPICQEEISIPFKFEALQDNSMARGVGTIISRPDLRFQSLFQKASKIALANRDSLGEGLNSIFVCPVQIKISGFHNDTPQPNASGADFFSERIQTASKTIKISYYFSNHIDFRYVKVL